MFKRIIVVSLCLLGLIGLTGCGLFGPDADDPRLVNEYEAAREALQEAEFEQADQYATERYNEAVNTFEVVKQEHQESPSEEIIAKYRRAQIISNRATIDALKSRMDDREERLQETNRQIESLESEIEQSARRASSLQASLETYKDTAAEHQNLQQELQQTRQAQQEQARELSSLRAERNRLSDEVEQYQRVIDNMEENIDQIRERTQQLQARLDEKTAELEKLQEENRAIAAEFEAKVQEAEIRQEKDGIVVNLDSKILFDIGDDLLKEDAKSTLQKIAEVLNNYPDRDIHVEGHTCDMPIRERYPSNWELSSHRALSVLKYLVYAQDVGRDRIAAVAYGQFNPLVPNDSDTNRQLNRRVEIKLLPPEIEVETRELIED